MDSIKWQNIWKACGDRVKGSLISFPRVWRAVEDQSRASIIKLVDTLEDSQILEEILDEKFPPRVPKNYLNHHYLLYGPFRYPPLRYGSRFGSKKEHGIWYGSLERETVLAEKSYYLFLFRQDTTATLEPTSGVLTLFSIGVQSAQCLELTGRPFEGYRSEISSLSSYDVSQRLGSKMRTLGISCFTFHSSRMATGINFGAFIPDVFTSKAVPASHQEGWIYKVSDGLVEYQPKFKSDVLTKFSVDDFLVAGKIPSIPLN